MDVLKLFHRFRSVIPVVFQALCQLKWQFLYPYSSSKSTADSNVTVCELYDINFHSSTSGVVASLEAMLSLSFHTGKVILSPEEIVL